MAYDVDEEPNGNSRRAFSGENKMIYYHVDNSVNCEIPSQKILQAAEE